LLQFVSSQTISIIIQIGGKNSQNGKLIDQPNLGEVINSPENLLSFHQSGKKVNIYPTLLFEDESYL